MSIHRERAFEDDVCAHLAANGWFHAEGDAANTDPATGTHPNDLLGWARDTQPELCAKFEAGQPADGDPGAALALAVRGRIQKDGLLRSLREGVPLLGVGRLALAQFRPASGVNEALETRYRRNRLRVVRQVRFDPGTNESLDLVLYLNGVAVATAELKTDFTQAVEDAVRQYRRDRDPKKHANSPLLVPGTGAVVHFAASGRSVRMTTRLAGEATRFLPFDRGDGTGGRGNPPNPDGYPSAHLWEEVWARDAWLDLLGRYAVEVRGRRGELQSVVFPRYHQWDAVRRLLGAVSDEGPGGRFLVQHSAGSGKTKSIAWAAHFLATLHAGEEKVFDSVLVVSDRRQIDEQLGEALEAMERTRGVVAYLKSPRGGGSKSSRLAEALAGGKKVVVCTMQTFPFALGAVRELAATAGKRFAVIADEAHSSQAGAAAARLKETLVGLDPEEGEGVSAEDVLVASMAARASKSEAVTYVAFTATPKAKTLELFGRASAAGGAPRPFHVYPMRQAIEEGFILDVLTNYLPYSVAMRLSAEDGAMVREVDPKRAEARVKSFVRLHPHNIAQKVAVVVEHFDRCVAGMLGREAKAMVVVGSRKEAVRWQLALASELALRGLPHRSYVAFSGEVDDSESSLDPLSEASSLLNPGLGGRELARAFDEDADARLLVVADKFQTGFDQPKLCAMYVDKPLAGVAAVQTLSRLNRCHPGKDRVYVLDFQDQADEVLAAFRVYHEEATLDGPTDPNLVVDLAQKVEGYGLFDRYELGRVLALLAKPRGEATQKELYPAVTPVSQRMRTAYEVAVAAGDDEAREALLAFRSDASSYVKAYAFLSQLVDYGDARFEELALFLRVLLPTLSFEREAEAVDLSGVELTHHRLSGRGERDLGLGHPGEGEDEPTLLPMSAVGTAAAREAERRRLAEVLERLNELFAGVGGLTDADLVGFVGQVEERLKADPRLVAQAAGNSAERFAHSPELGTAVEDAVLESAAAGAGIGSALAGDPDKLAAFLQVLVKAGLHATLLRMASSAEGG